MLLWDLVKPLVHWRVGERERRLFPVCVQVQATLMARHPGYRTPNVQEVPPALAEEVKALLKEMLGGEFSQDC